MRKNSGEKVRKIEERERERERIEMRERERIEKRENKKE